MWDKIKRTLAPVEPPLPPTGGFSVPSLQEKASHVQMKPNAERRTRMPESAGMIKDKPIKGASLGSLGSGAAPEGWLHGSTGIRLLLLASLILHIVCAWFSVGYNHTDEHHQILGFAAYKLSEVMATWLPWEYGAQVRPGLQPWLAYTVTSALRSAGASDPYLAAFLLRLLAAVAGWGAQAATLLYGLKRLKVPALRTPFLLLNLTLWFLPYLHARFSSEGLAGSLFFMGLPLALWAMERKSPFKKSTALFVAGALLGLAFVCRYQMAFSLAGFGLWLLMLGKKEGEGRGASLRSMLLPYSMLIIGGLAALAVGALADKWLYGQWTVPAVNYFRVNLLEGKAAEFGVSPWWYYFTDATALAIPPVSVILFVSFFVTVFYRWREPFVWAVVPFLLGHILIGHKETRFLFPLAQALPLLAVLGWDKLLAAKGQDAAGKLFGRVKPWLIYLFWLPNTVLLGQVIFRPAQEIVKMNREIYQASKGYPKILIYALPETKPLFADTLQLSFYNKLVVDANPLRIEMRTGANVETFKPLMGKDTVAFFLNDKYSDPMAGDQRAELIYRSFPAWIRHFNFFHWQERTKAFTLYKLKG